MNSKSSLAATGFKIPRKHGSEVNVHNTGLFYVPYKAIGQNRIVRGFTLGGHYQIKLGNIICGLS